MAGVEEFLRKRAMPSRVAPSHWLPRESLGITVSERRTGQVCRPATEINNMIKAMLPNLSFTHTLYKEPPLLLSLHGAVRLSASTSIVITAF